MIYVCDAMMGCGKSTAAIHYMNAHADKKFIYASPMIDETERIKQACPGLNFILPNNFDKKHEHKKIKHLESLLRDGRNVAVSHMLLSLCEPDMIDIIKERGYILILDEVVDVFQPIKIKKDDMDMLIHSGFLNIDAASLENGSCEVASGMKDYAGDWARAMKIYADSHRLVAVKSNHGKTCLYSWAFNLDILTAFQDVVILTYLFRASSLCWLFQINGVAYRNIGVRVDNPGDYQFTDCPDWDRVHSETADLARKIHILRNDRMNYVSSPKKYNRTMLSIAWSDRAAADASKENIMELKRHLDNFFNNIHRGGPSKNRLWTCHKSIKSALSGKGYTKRYLVFNRRATNQYRNCDVLAYCANVFINVSERRYFESRGILIDDDLYALSIMLQWIWRSAIRDGKDIDIYIPSVRMRILLENWIAEAVRENKN